MEFHKIADTLNMQAYTIKSPTKDWKTVFPKKYVYIVYYQEDKETVFYNTDDFLQYEFSYCLQGNSFIYMFTTEQEAKVKRLFKVFNIPIIEPKRKFPFDRVCGFNACNPSLFSSKSDAILSIMSLTEEEYPPMYTFEQMFVTAKYETIMQIDNNNFTNVIAEMVAREMSNDVSKSDKFVNFILLLKNNFPLNHGATIRRFYKTITSKDFDISTKMKGGNKTRNSKTKVVANKKKTEKTKIKGGSSVPHYYIGFDIRNHTAIEENAFIEKLESLTNYCQEYVPVCETYNNPITEIIKICDSLGIKYEKRNKKVIAVKTSDYTKLAYKLKSTIADFV